MMFRHRPTHTCFSNRWDGVEHCRARIAHVNPKINKEPPLDLKDTADRIYRIKESS